jgi:hypothetical protein
VTVTSAPSALLGAFLRDQLAQHHCHATLHGLEGLAREALVGLAQTSAERDHQTRGDPGVLDHQPTHVRAEHRHHTRLLNRFNRSRAALVLEQRQLAEDVTRAERRERDYAPTGVLACRTGATGADDVAGVARVALAEHNLARLKRARNREIGDPLQVLVFERGEHRHAREQLHHVR